MGALSPTLDATFFALSDPKRWDILTGLVVDSRCEMRVDGAWEVAFGPSLVEFYRHRHVFEAIERPHRLLATTETRLDGAQLTFNTECTFAKRDEATLMTVIQWGFPPDELRDKHGRGVPHAFDRLARALSTVSVRSMRAKE